MKLCLAAGGAWKTGRGESHLHVAPEFPRGPGHNTVGHADIYMYHNIVNFVKLSSESVPG